jgi:hypothetical protein
MPDCSPAASRTKRGEAVEKKAQQNLEYMHKGVTISPASPVVGDKVKILYDGALSKNGAAEVFAHIGYGQGLDNEQEVPMVRSGTCFEATVPALKEDFMKVSFHDPLNNLDDNAGNWYNFDITG